MFSLRSLRITKTIDEAYATNRNDTWNTPVFLKKKKWCPRNHFLPVKQTLSQKTNANGCMREPIELTKVKYNLETTTPTVILNLQIFRGHKWYSQEAFGCPWYQFTKMNMVSCHGVRWGFPHRSKIMPCQKCPFQGWRFTTRFPAYLYPIIFSWERKWNTWLGYIWVLTAS